VAGILWYTICYTAKVAAGAGAAILAADKRKDLFIYFFFV
jgi:hypothetical protein